VIDLNDRRLVDDLYREIDERIRAAFEARLDDIRFGPVDAVDTSTRKASVILGGQSSPGFSYGERVPEVGDWVACLVTRKGSRMILRILSRDIEEASPGGAQVQVSHSEAVGTAADYLARMKLEADPEYRLLAGLDSSDRPHLLLGDGTVLDLRAYRSAAETLTIDDGAGGAATLNVVGALKENGTDVSLDGHSHAFYGAEIQIATGTTGSIAGASNADVTITWASNFANANYTVLVQFELNDATQRFPPTYYVRTDASKRAVGSCVITVRNNAAATALNFSYRAIGILD
jgi:hypothetical protein